MEKNNNENKYSKILEQLWRIPVGFLLIFTGLFFMVLPLILNGENSELYPMICLITFAFGGFLVLQGIGIAFYKQEHESTGMVHDGETIIRAKQTLSYIKRTVIYCFCETAAYLGLALYFFISSINAEFPAILIVCGVIAVIVSIVYFLNGMKRKTDIKNTEKKN